MAARYREGEFVVLDTWTGQTIPKSDNMDYFRYLEWAKTNTPDPWETLDEVKVQTMNKIDIEADALRIFFAVDALRAIEYQLAYSEAKAFKVAGYAGTVPMTVSSWAEANGRSAQDAADDIISIGDKWYGLIYLIRDIRLRAKAFVKNATAIADCNGKLEEVKQVFAAIKAQNSNL